MLKNQRFLPISGLLTSALLGLLSACGSSDSTPAASDLKAEFSIHGVTGTINGKQVTVDLTSKEACSDISALVTGINTGGATISPDPSVARNYSAPVDFTLTFPDGTKVVYTVTVKSNECVVPTPTPSPTPPPPVATPTPPPTPTPAPTPYVPPTLPASLTDINVGDNGGINPVTFTINMPVLSDPSGNQIAYSVAGLPATDGFGAPVFWNINQSGANLAISGNYMGAGITGTVTAYSLQVTSTNATGSTSVSLRIQTN